MLQTLRHSDTQTLRHSDTQTLRHSDTQTLRHSDTQTLRHSDTQTLRHSDTQTLRHSDTQTLRHSDTQTLRHSDTLCSATYCLKSSIGILLFYFQQDQYKRKSQYTLPAFRSIKSLFHSIKISQYTLPVSHSKGFSVLEVLIIAGISSVILAGSLKTLSFSMQSSQLARSVMHEQNLMFTLYKTISNEGDCKNNLKPVGDINDKGIGELTQLRRDTIPGPGSIALEKGARFKNHLDIIKMELLGDNTEDPGTGVVERVFTVYYQKTGIGHLNTIGGDTCSNSDTGGCYFNSCTLQYKLSGTNVTTCNILDCTDTSGNAFEQTPCYTMDEVDETLDIWTEKGAAKGKGRALVGCGGASDIESSGFTAFGFGAGASNTTGHLNTFIGYKAGHSNTTGYLNTFIGTYAGEKATSSHNNVIIGESAGQNFTNGIGNTLLGYKAGRAVSAGNFHGNTLIGGWAGSHSTEGGSNTFIGIAAGQFGGGVLNITLGNRAGALVSTSGGYNILIGGGVSYGDPAGNNQLNIGNIILGRLKRVPNTICDGISWSACPPGYTMSPNIHTLRTCDTDNVDEELPCAREASNWPSSFLSSAGIYIDGNLKVAGNLDFTGDFTRNDAPVTTLPASSRIYKKNIKPFNNFGEALQDIVATPLFTYEYKKDHPEKSRRGVISEELPRHLQIQSKEAPVVPDWPSIYGTLWAGIKALHKLFVDFRKDILSKFTEELAKVFKALKNTKATQDQKIKQLKTIQTEELAKVFKDLKNTKAAQDQKIKQLKTIQTEELAKVFKDLKNIKATQDQKIKQLAAIQTENTRLSRELEEQKSKNTRLSRELEETKEQINKLKPAIKNQPKTE